MQRRSFTQALSIGVISGPLPLAFVACGGGTEQAPVASAPPAATALPVDPQTLTASGAPTELLSVKPAVVQERVFVGPGGTVYTLNRRAKTLTSVNGVIHVGSKTPATAKSQASGALRSAPIDVGFDATGHVYVLDKSMAEVRVYSDTGTLLRQFGKSGSGIDALLNPSALTVYQDRVLIADSANHRIQVFSTVGVALSRFGELQAQGGGINYPKDVEVAADGSIYVLQGGKSLVTVYTSAGVQTQQFDLSKTAQGQLQNISAIALSPAGVLYAADPAQGCVYLVAKDGSLTMQAIPTTISSAGKPTAARFVAVGSGEQLHLSGFVALRS